MAKIVRNISKKAGLPPGSLIHVGESKTEEVKITIFHYDEEKFEEFKYQDVGCCAKFREIPGVSWINVDGVHEPGIIEEIGNAFNLHPLIQEDILNTNQRPKLEDLGDHLFIVLKMIRYEGDELIIEHVSLILGSSFVLSFQEDIGDVFDPIRERIKNHKGRIRKMGPDFLIYSLLDTIVDNYFIIIDRFGDSVEDIEERILNTPSSLLLQLLHGLKFDIILLKKNIWPLRDMISRLEKGESPLITDSTVLFFRDIHDHTIQVIDTLESFREMLTGMLDIYLSSVSNRLNEVMKVLTIISTIFIPLSFIAGVYGMNFENMPELHNKWGYFIVIGIMFILGVIMLAVFWKKKWLSKNSIF